MKTVHKTIAFTVLELIATVCYADDGQTVQSQGLLVNFPESGAYNQTALNIESLNYYRALAKDYQARANFYNGLVGIYESSPGFAINNVKESKVKYNPLKGTQLSIGAGGSSGNNSTSNAQGNLIINYKPSESNVGWNFNTLGQYDYLYSSNDGVQKNRLYLQQNGFYMFNKYNGLFGQASYLNDVTNGYYYTWNENIGYQLQVFKTDRQNLLLSIGPGLQQRQVVAPSSNNQTGPSWLTQITYNLNINNAFTLTEQLQNVATQLNTSTSSISAITIQAYKNVGIGLTYQFTYNSVPEPKIAGLSSITGVTFVYSLN